MKQEQKYFSFDSGIVLMNMPLEEGKITESRGGYRYTYDHVTQSFCNKTSTQRYKHGFQTLILPVMFLTCSRNPLELREANRRGRGREGSNSSVTERIAQI